LGNSLCQKLILVTFRQLIYLGTSVPQIDFMGRRGAERPDACLLARQLEPGWAQGAPMRFVPDESHGIPFCIHSSHSAIFFLGHFVAHAQHQTFQTFG
jgi:hypothetical protein